MQSCFWHTLWNILAHRGESHLPQPNTHTKLRLQYHYSKILLPYHGKKAAKTRNFAAFGSFFIFFSLFSFFINNFFCFSGELFFSFILPVEASFFLQLHFIFQGKLFFPHCRSPYRRPRLICLFNLSRISSTKDSGESTSTIGPKESMRIRSSDSSFVSYFILKR